MTPINPLSNPIPPVGPGSGFATAEPYTGGAVLDDGVYRSGDEFEIEPATRAPDAAPVAPGVVATAPEPADSGASITSTNDAARGSQSVMGGGPYAPSAVATDQARIGAGTATASTHPTATIADFQQLGIFTDSELAQLASSGLTAQQLGQVFDDMVAHYQTPDGKVELQQRIEAQNRISSQPTTSAAPLPTAGTSGASNAPQVGNVAPAIDPRGDAQRYQSIIDELVALKAFRADELQRIVTQYATADSLRQFADEAEHYFQTPAGQQELAARRAGQFGGAVFDPTDPATTSAGGTVPRSPGDPTAMQPGAASGPAWNKEWAKKLEAAMMKRGASPDAALLLMGQIQSTNPDEASLQQALAYFETPQSDTEITQANDAARKAASDGKKSELKLSVGSSIVTGGLMAVLARSSANAARQIEKIALDTTVSSAVRENSLRLLHGINPARATAFVERHGLHRLASGMDGPVTSEMRQAVSDAIRSRFGLVRSMTKTGALRNINAEEFRSVYAGKSFLQRVGYSLRNFEDPGLKTWTAPSLRGGGATTVATAARTASSEVAGTAVNLASKVVAHQPWVEAALAKSAGSTAAAGVAGGGAAAAQRAGATALSRGGALSRIGNGIGHVAPKGVGGLQGALRGAAPLVALSAVFGGIHAYQTYKAEGHVGAATKGVIAEETGRTVGTLAGGAIGQALIPIPGVGAVVGGAVGSWAGAMIGSKVGHWLFH